MANGREIPWPMAAYADHGYKPTTRVSGPVQGSWSLFVTCTWSTFAEEHSGVPAPLIGPRVSQGADALGDLIEVRTVSLTADAVQCDSAENSPSHRGRRSSHATRPMTLPLGGMLL